MAKESGFVSRRSVLQHAARTAGVTAILCDGQRRADATIKISKAAVAYQITPTATRNVANAPSLNRLPGASWFTVQSVCEAIAGSLRRRGKRRIERSDYVEVARVQIARHSHRRNNCRRACTQSVAKAHRRPALYARQTGQPCATWARFALAR
jgi:hypothetical protein